MSFFFHLLTSGGSEALLSASIENATPSVLNLSFGRAVNITTASWTIISDSGVTISSVLSGDGTKTPKFQLSRNIYAGETLYLFYSGGGATEFVSGAVALDALYEEITNNSAQVARSPEQMVIDGDLIASSVLYFDAESSVTVNGSNEVTLWDEKISGLAARRLTGVAGFLPDYITDANGKRWLRFDEATMSANPGSAPAFSSTANDYTLFLVKIYRGDVPVNPQENQRIYDQLNVPRIIISDVHGPTVPFFYQGSSNGGSVNGSTGPVLDALHIVEFGFQEPNQTIRLNNVLIGSSAVYVKQTHQGSSVNFGGASDADGSLNIDLDAAKFVFIKGTLSSALRNEIFGFLRSSYNPSQYQTSAFLPVGTTPSFDSETVIEVGGASGLNYNAFPSLAIDSNNKLFLVYRKGSDHNQTLDGSIVLKTSTDAGVTWSAETEIRAPYAAHFATDPSITITSTGRVIVFWNRVNGGDRQMWFRYSDDGGSSWSVEARMTTDYDTPGMISGPGEAIEVDGVLYKPCYARIGATGDREGPLYKSLDNGLTWSLQALMYPTNSADYEEPTIIDNGDGLCICLIRSDSQQSTRWIYSPTDNMFVSRSTWTASNDLSAGKPQAATSIGKNPMAKSPSGLIVALGRNKTDFRTIMFYSANRGQTWVSAYADARTGAYEYAGIVYHPGVGQFIAVYAVETAASITDLVCRRWNEV